MKTKLAIGFLFVLLCSANQYAQVSAYTFTQSQGTYGSPNTGTLAGLPFQDDDVTNVSLPFTFSYNGANYNSVNVCSNGHLSFNAIFGMDYTPVSTNTTQNVLSAFGTDLMMGVLIVADLTAGSNTLTNCSSVVGYSVGDVLMNYNTNFTSNPVITSISGNNIVVNANAVNSVSSYNVINSHGYIKQNVSGIMPNRICEFEFANFCRYGISDEVINFKIRLYETTNKIEFLYGTIISGFDNTPCEVGLKGSSNGDFNSRRVNSSTLWNNSASASIISDVCDFDTSVFPANGQSYMWSPVSCTVPVLSITAINPTLCSGSQAVLTASGATTYSWSNGPTVAQNTVTPSTTTGYTVIGANGTCTSSSVYLINVVPTPTLNINQSSTHICYGQTATLTASGASSYSWNGIGGTSQSIVSPTITTTYTLKGKNGNCVATQTVVQTLVTMPSPVTLTASSNHVCPGQSVTIIAGGATSYTWTGTGSIATPNSPSVVVGAGMYTVTLSNGPGACSISALMIIVIADCTGIDEISKTTISILTYPNPFASILYLENTTDKDQLITISDALGKIVYRANINANSKESFFDDKLKSGLYFVSVNGSVAKKLIKE